MKSVIKFLISWACILHAGLTLAAPTRNPEGAKKEHQEESESVVFQFNNPLHQNILNQPTKPVKKLPDPEIDLLIHKMKKTVKLKNGVGISANQIGVPLQVFLTSSPMKRSVDPVYDVYINPVITRTSSSISCFWHGCLSAEGKKYGNVATWEKITVEAQDQKGNKFRRDLGGIDAIIFQHEFRHLLGGGYHQYASDFKEERELRRRMTEGRLKLIEPCRSGEKLLLEDYKVGESIEAYSKGQRKVASP